VDITPVNKIRKLLSLHETCDSVYTEREIAYCQRRKATSHQHFAARFAAKEAVLKALGSGLRGTIKWTDIEVITEGSGKPAVRLHGAALQAALDANVDYVLVSLSHCEEYAIAQAVAVQDAG